MIHKKHVRELMISNAIAGVAANPEWAAKSSEEIAQRAIDIVDATMEIEEKRIKPETETEDQSDQTQEKDDVSFSVE